VCEIDLVKGFLMLWAGSDNWSWMRGTTLRTNQHVKDSFHRRPYSIDLFWYALLIAAVHVVENVLNTF
jgi:hypothetical protein